MTEKHKVTWGNMQTTLQDAHDMTQEWKKTRHAVTFWGIFTGVILPTIFFVVERFW